MNKRLKQLIDYYGISTRQFEQKINVSNGVIAKVLVQNTTLRSDVLSKIADSFPDINIGWILTGKGEMFLQKSGNTPEEDTRFVKIPTDVWEAMQMQTESLKKKDDQISQLIEMLKGNNGNSEGAGQGKKDRHAEEAGGRL